ncbi:MAG: hypothetical protein IPK99_13800 [Flavobacteriales bacterium]|nr:hypothetical protein [Flavobacteriales bacterium]
MHTAVGQFARRVTEKLVGSGKLLDGHTASLSTLSRNKLSQQEAAKMREFSNALVSHAQRGFQLIVGRINGIEEAIARFTG